MNRPVHFEIQADNIERAKTFYEKVLGWKIEQMMKKEEGGMDYWGLDTGDSTPGINGGLYARAEGTDKLYTYDCTIAVEDVDKAVEAVKANGGTVLREKSEIPGVGFFARCKDTEGNLFGLMQPTGWDGSK
ncbi:MAG: Glyoxalase family protein [Parcubacteria group bacterium]|nr:Glyoxalase family protein [Parcubacteria group bacterium]